MWCWPFEESLAQRVASLTSRGSRRESLTSDVTADLTSCVVVIIHPPIHLFNQDCWILLNHTFETRNTDSGSRVTATPMFLLLLPQCERGCFAGMGFSVSWNQWNSCYDSGKRSTLTIALAKEFMSHQPCSETVWTPGQHHQWLTVTLNMSLTSLCYSSVIPRTRAMLLLQRVRMNIK